MEVKIENGQIIISRTVADILAPRYIEIRNAQILAKACEEEGVELDDFQMSQNYGTNTPRT